MDLCLLRHATAVAGGAAEDAARELSPEGIEAMKEAAKGLRRLEDGFDGILTSPCRRARQTAEIVGEELRLSRRIEVEKALAPGAGATEILRVVRERADADSLLLVGHNPDFEEAIAYSICGKGNARLALKKGGIEIIRFEGEIESGSGQLLTLMTCRQLRMLAD